MQVLRKDMQFFSTCETFRVNLGNDQSQVNVEYEVKQTPVR
jgi:hypothetical protein